MARSHVIGALPRMPLQVMQYVVAIEQHGSIQAAAQAVHLTASALGRQVAQLEHELGVTLFERHSRGVRLTVEGEVFLDAARQMLQRMERLAADLGEVHALGRGHVSVQASEALVADILMPQLSQLGREHPQISVDVVVSSGRQAERALLDGKAELALVFNARSDANLVVVAEHACRLVAVVSPAHALAACGTVSADTLLLDTRLALPPRTYATRIAFEALLSAEHRARAPHLTINSIAALKGFAASGAGVAVLPAFAVASPSPNAPLAVLAIDAAEHAGTRICLCRQAGRTLSAAAEHLLGRLANALAALPAQG